MSTYPQVDNTTTLSHIQALDGLRGLLALWVFLGHLANGVGYTNYVLAAHALAVDVFMILSGFLMVYVWKGSSNSPAKTNTALIKFYISRVFRIAPLYYVLLLVCYLLLPTLAAMQDAVLRVIPPPWASEVMGYYPQTNWNFDSWNWLVLHLSFLFGVVPGMEATTPLPDWSLSLEMQFYLIFPALLFLIYKCSPMVIAMVACIASFLSPVLFGLYLQPGLYAHFGQPSLLSYRLCAFVLGMLVAMHIKRNVGHDPPQNRWFYFIIPTIICLLPLSKPVMLIYLIFVGIALGRLNFLANILSRKPFQYLGQVSYSFYLCHLLILIPLNYLLLINFGYAESPPWVRFWITVAISLPLALALSSALYYVIESPSIKLGRSLLTKIKGN